VFIVAVASPVAAQISQPAGGGMEVGPWEAYAYASGTATAKVSGMDAVWTGDIPAEFELNVGDTAVKGTWMHQGSGTLHLSGTVQGVSADARATYSFTGSGSVTGTSSELTLDGSSRTVGTLKTSAAGSSISEPIDNTTTIPTLHMTVQATTCDEAYGDWTFAVDAAFQGEGFTPSIDGYWMALRNTEEAKAGAAALLDQAAMEVPTEAPDEVSASPLLQESAILLHTYNDYVSMWSDVTMDQTMTMLTEAQNLLNAFRNLSSCDKRLYGADNVEQYFDGLTFVIQNLILGKAAEADSAGWASLIEVASATGAIGPGAPDPALAVKTEQALIDAGQAILEANTSSADPTQIVVNDTTTRVMTEGAIHGWTYTVNGSTYDARHSYASTLGSTP